MAAAAAAENAFILPRGRRDRVSALSSLLLLTAIACEAAPGAGETGDDAPITYAQHIAPIVEARCGACHDSGGIGGFSLLSYDALETWGNYASDVIRDREMPPFPPDDAACRPTHGDPRAMTQEEREMFRQWNEDGHPLGDPGAPPEYEVLLPASDLDAPTHRFALTQSYVPPVEVFEEYRCFRVDPGLVDAVPFEALHVDTPTPERFHQARVSVLPADRVAEAEALEGSDGRPGWPCFYNPGIDGLDWVGGMSPGRAPAPLPDGTALTLEPGAQLVVDGYLHHYDLDPLEVEVVGWETTAPVSPARFVRLRPDDVVIPSGAETHEELLRADVVAVGEDLSARPPDAPPALHAGAIWSVDVHLHQWGRAARVEVERANGGSECVLDIPRWDVEWQGAYRLATPLRVEPGDQVTIRCRWANAEADQPLVNGVQIQPADVGWGLDERSETCDVQLGMAP
jgi:hypothetical protein